MGIRIRYCTGNREWNTIDDVFLAHAQESERVREMQWRRWIRSTAPKNNLFLAACIIASPTSGRSVQKSPIDVLVILQNFNNNFLVFPFHL